MRRFHRGFSHFFRNAILGGNSAAILPRVFALFSQCGFKGIFSRRFHRGFSHFFRSAILVGNAAAISPRVFVLFSRCGVRGVFSQRFHREFSHFFRSAVLGGYYRGYFAASFRTFFSVRF